MHKNKSGLLQLTDSLSSKLLRVDVAKCLAGSNRKKGTPNKKMHETLRCFCDRKKVNVTMQLSLLLLS